MRCPTCHSPDWKPAESGGLLSGLLGRKPKKGEFVARRKCLHCGTVYTVDPIHEREDDEDAIAERMSQLEERVSRAFRDADSGGNSALPNDLAGIELREKIEMRCEKCGHFALITPSDDAACPNCGRLYAKVKKEAPKYKDVGGI